ncbi:capsule assembly Wzi family protein [Algoriphagus persicinus]|uniref:capsule assembly Wzi family protein n=1 Tax=Algoriphagus persicinus TaxID=3108754 RepID=UPI002B3DB3CF|nr:capsule assembly Wzi family protein [Algoriphagus sp. E1-3-M2]MEB2786957.1 capsule assembly Wzi family protein [Algoriphagus sp. E1-3-M2]
MKIPILFVFFFSISVVSYSQVMGPNFWDTEIQRRQQVLGDSTVEKSFLLNPLSNLNDKENELLRQSKFGAHFLPIFASVKGLNNRAYGWGDFGMIPSPGVQFDFMPGVRLHYKDFLIMDIQPEFVFGSNDSYSGYQGFGKTIDEAKFYFWNTSEFPERFGDGSYKKIGWGQSSLTLGFGAFEGGISTKNLWWGPGQWNSLIFSNNAPGFLHFTLNTRRPVKTFLGDFEGQLIMGQLKNGGYPALQNGDLNSLYFRPFTDDWRYVNGITLNYSPKWVRGLSLGFSRTFQVYHDLMKDTFWDYFPIFEGFQKVKFLENDQSVEYDGNGRSQQFSLFGRYYFTKAKAEFYFEYGRRDHSYNWREFILNPEHARAYIIGLNKIIPNVLNNYDLQLRSEITHQQESVNRIIRYGPLGGLSWHSHTRARGFSHLGQPLGVGLGPGSNVQIMEISLVDKYDKMGLSFERLENHNDFYYRAFGQQKERKPWVDLSIGFLFDKKWDNLLLSSKLQVINARNYQWQLDPASTPDFPKGENLTSFMAQTSLIYFWNNK